MLAAITASAVAGLSCTSLLADAAATTANSTGTVPAILRRFIADYMAAMNAPGLTLSLADRNGLMATGAYGFANLSLNSPVLSEHLFEIGSISKSFAALSILQLRDEGKLDVQDPILRYLPWLRTDEIFGVIRIHHLLTHTSGMPDDAPMWPLETAGRIRQGFAPGTRFHYSNWGFDVLGQLIEKLDGSSWPEAVTRRILKPLGMRDTAAAITNSARSRIVQSYVPRYDDRPYPRHGELVPAGNFNHAQASGCLASCSADMGRYMQMLLNRGAGPSGRLVSDSGFTLFSTPHIEAREFGPTASYGYGIVVDHLDGHTCLRHTGGMPSFMSAMQLDMDAGLAAFASINAQQGYRPNPVAEYALRILQRTAAHEPPPAPPPPDASVLLSNPADYVGTYIAPDGRRLEVKLEGGNLILESDGISIGLQHSVGEQFIANHPRFALFPLLFGRGVAAPRSDPPQKDSPQPALKVVDLSHGADWYARGGVSADSSSPAIVELEPYPGLYQENPWSGMTRVVSRRGQLWIDGVLPLVPIGGRLFRLADEPSSPETVEFRDVIDGKAQMLFFSGAALRRVLLPKDA